MRSVERGLSFTTRDKLRSNDACDQPQASKLSSGETENQVVGDSYIMVFNQWANDGDPPTAQHWMGGRCTPTVA